MILYLDTETTGLYPGNICQLSYVMQGENITAKNMFFSVDFVEYGAYAVHGFSVEKLKELSGGSRFSDRIEEIEKDFLSADLVVSHNTAFDFMFLRKEFETNGKILPVYESFCSMKGMTSVCKIRKSSGFGYKYPKLNELCSFLGISERDIAETSMELFGDRTGYHDARFDTVGVYLAVNKAVESNYLDKLKKFL